MEMSINKNWISTQMSAIKILLFTAPYNGIYFKCDSREITFRGEGD
jgi:hypothetical protein